MVRRWREGEEREKKMMWKAVEPKEGAFRLELSGNTVERNSAGREWAGNARSMRRS